jgi:hypothetical protein
MKIPNGAHITWRREFVRCGRASCATCATASALGHGPYWYAYATVNGCFGKCYVGRNRAAWERARALGVELPKRARSASNTQSPKAGKARSKNNSQTPEGTPDQRAMLLRGATPKLAARVLGVLQGSTLSQIKSAFRVAIRAAHPDAGGNNTAAAAVSAAYALLQRIVSKP